MQVPDRSSRDALTAERYSVARNRKRAKERRARRPAQVARPRSSAEPAAPNPIEHATPDVELAEAQLAYGRPEDAGVPSEVPETNGELVEADGEPGGVLPEDAALAEEENGRLADEQIDEEQLAHLHRASQPSSSVLPSYGRGVPDADPADTRGVSVGDAAVARSKVGTVPRLVNFLQGSWNELQRVQWPDRRQVLQATGVVIGFVIVAGVFLGLADLVASKLVTYILK
ncbi:MAG: preprotein translocase subunit SecE [Actinomycetota bacterium]|nr:preprotein translocase subunit SecE [Actinomycetota bacterium]